MRLVTNNKQSFNKQPSKNQLQKNSFFVYSIKIVNLSLNELKTIAKVRGIKGYISMSEERLLSVLNESESVKESEKNFYDQKWFS